MAFYTVIGELELQALLERYGIGELSSCVGVSDGIENTTYILTADSQQWILTLFEDLSAIELPFFVRLMTWLHEQKLPVACPLIDKNGQTLQVCLENLRYCFRDCQASIRTILLPHIVQ